MSSAHCPTRIILSLSRSFLVALAGLLFLTSPVGAQGPTACETSSPSSNCGSSDVTIPVGDALGCSLENLIQIDVSNEAVCDVYQYGSSNYVIVGRRVGVSTIILWTKTGTQQPIPKAIKVLIVLPKEVLEKLKDVFEKKDKDARDLCLTTNSVTGKVTASGTVRNENIQANIIAFLEGDALPKEMLVDALVVCPSCLPPDMSANSVKERLTADLNRLFIKRAKLCVEISGNGNYVLVSGRVKNKKTEEEVRQLASGYETDRVKVVLSLNDCGGWWRDCDFCSTVVTCGECK